MLGVVVKGGTSAGRRIIREPKTEWTCRCPISRVSCDDASPLEGSRCTCGGDCGIHVPLRPATLTRCPDCGTRRP